MKQPNLFVTGFPKSGTSSLFDYLGQHNDIYASFRKEPHIYTYKSRFENRKVTGEYLSFQNLYSKSEKEKYIIDASTTYMISDLALERIKIDSPDAKIIIIARDPIERVFSHYNWIKSLGIEVKSFKREIKEWDELSFNPDVVFSGNFKNYIEFSKYGEQIEKCLKIFSKEQVLILPFEMMKDGNQKFMNCVFEFLDLKPIKINAEIKNATAGNTFKERKWPFLIKNIYTFIPKGIKLNLKKRLNFLYKKKIKNYKFNSKEEKFIYNYLEEDINWLRDNGFCFNEWKTVKKQLK